VLKQCRSPNITEYYGCEVAPGTSRLLIVMELMAVSVAGIQASWGGYVPARLPVLLMCALIMHPHALHKAPLSPSADLIDANLGGAPLPEPHVAYVLREALNALVYLHAENRMHRCQCVHGVGICGWVGRWVGGRVGGWIWLSEDGLYCKTLHTCIALPLPSPLPHAKHPPCWQGHQGC
jgi:hypothetical protein